MATDSHLRLETPTTGGKRTLPDRKFSDYPLLLGLLSVATIVAIWSLLTYSGSVPDDILPSPTGLLRQFILLVQEGYRGANLFEHTWASLKRTLLGFLFALAIGVPFGLLLGTSSILNSIFTPVLSFFRPIPPIAFIPLVVLYLGIGELPKIILVFYASFIYIIINVQAGVNSIPGIYYRAGQSLGLTKPQIFCKVVFPAALPNIMAGIRVAVAVSWGVVVAAELIAADSGLGFMIQSAGAFFDLPTIYCGIIVIGVIGFAMDWIVLTASASVLHWQGK